MLRIQHVSALLGVHPDTVRNYERRGLVPRAKRSPINGYRYWTDEDAEVIRRFARQDCTTATLGRAQ